MTPAEIQENVEFLREFGAQLHLDATAFLSNFLSENTSSKGLVRGDKANPQDLKDAARNAVLGAEKLDFLISVTFKNTQDYTAENYAQFLKDVAGMIPAAYIFVELAKSKNPESLDLLKDIVINHPEIESIIDRYCDPNFSREGYSAFWDLQHKMGEIYDKSFPKNTPVDKYYLRPLHIAINALEEGDLKTAYQAYYKTLHNELNIELQRRLEIPRPANLDKIKFYQAVGLKYFKLLNILNSDISQAEKEKSIKEAYEFSNPSWMPRALKAAAAKFMVATQKTDFEQASDKLDIALQTRMGPRK